MLSLLRDHRIAVLPLRCFLVSFSVRRISRFPARWRCSPFFRRWLPIPNTSIYTDNFRAVISEPSPRAVSSRLANLRKLYALLDGSINAFSAFRTSPPPSFFVRFVFPRKGFHFCLRRLCGRSSQSPGKPGRGGKGISGLAERLYAKFPPELELSLPVILHVQPISSS